MTFSELTSAATLLGFNDTLFPDSILVNSVNLALTELYTTRPVYRTVRFAAGGLTPLLYCKEINVTPGQRIEYTAEGSSYSVRIHGTCNFLVKHGEQMDLFNVETGQEAKLFKGVIYPGSTLSFWSSYAFSIFDLSIYDRVYSGDAEDVPDGGHTTSFDLRRLYGDFMSFTSPATDTFGVPLKNCRLIDGKIEIDSTYAGEIVITYRRLPEMCIGEAEEGIDLPKEYESVFPLLVASYLWLGNEVEKAKHYRSIYEDLIGKMGSGGYAAINSFYEITDGWA